MKIALLPCARTEWRQEGRLLGRVELSPLSGALDECRGWAPRLSASDVGRVLHGPDELSTATAGAVAKSLGVRAKALDELAEVDVGLWAGLTAEQLEGRYESVYHELLEAPLNVTPPNGEALGQAYQRLDVFFRSRLRRLKPRNREGIGLVLRPLVLAMAWCVLGERDVSGVWQIAQTAGEPVIIDIAQRQRAAPSAPAPTATSE